MSLVREAMPEDAPQMAELLTELGYPAVSSNVAERLSHGAEAVFVVADGPRLDGLLAIWSQWPLARARPIARITAMVVRSEARRKGFGSLLVKRAVAWARSAGCDSIELTSGIRPKRQEAHRFYESVGFEMTAYRFSLRVTDADGGRPEPREVPRE